jgi:uncharacterized protein (DUF4213/DUF364 family)
MRSPITQQSILEAVVRDARQVPDHAVTSVTWGVCLAAVQSQYTGLASLVSHIAPKIGTIDQTAATGKTQSAHELAATLLDPATTNTDKASLAMAAINSLLPPPGKESDLPGQDLLLRIGKGKKVAVIGHFPFVTALRKVCDTCWVLEKRPQPGDVEASEAPNILPQADVVALTGTTLLNGTLADLLNLCRADATVVMVGPTTPYAPSLFTCGIDILAGCDVVDPNQALDGIRGGKCFKGLEGTRQTAWARPGLAV